MQNKVIAEYKLKFRTLLKGIRVDKGWSQDEMGAILGISAAAYGKWETVNEIGDSVIPRNYKGINNLIKHKVSRADVNALKTIVMTYRANDSGELELEEYGKDEGNDEEIDAESDPEIILLIKNILNTLSINLAVLDSSNSGQRSAQSLRDALTGRRNTSRAGENGNFGRHPAINISKEDAEAFTNWLNTSLRYYCLPTEIEWEFACGGNRKGLSMHPFSAGIARQHRGKKISPGEANLYFPSISRDSIQTAEVDCHKFRANEFLLMQMHGNVWEWCSNGFWGGYGVVKGGDCGSAPENAAKHAALDVASSTRQHFNYKIGFRVARLL